MWKNQLIFSMSSILFLNLFISHINPQRIVPLLGGYNDDKEQECLSAFNFAIPKLHSSGLFGDDISIGLCKKQIVRGTNYKIEINNSDGETCLLVVYQSLKGSKKVKKRKSTCFPKT